MNEEMLIASGYGDDPPAKDDGWQHESDCATHNMPAFPNGECDCSVRGRKQQLWELKFYGKRNR